MSARPTVPPVLREFWCEFCGVLLSYEEIRLAVILEDERCIGCRYPRRPPPSWWQRLAALWAERRMWTVECPEPGVLGFRRWRHGGSMVR